MLPAAVAVIVMEQLPDDRVHLVEENVTFPLPETFDQMTVPVCDAYPLATFAVHVIGAPGPKDDCVHDIVTEVGAFVIVSLAVRALPWLLESPR